jgi:hypothetical protein
VVSLLLILPLFCWPRLNDVLHISKKKKKTGYVCGLVMGPNTCSFLMESQLVGGFVEGQHKIKARRRAAKRQMAY